MQDPETIVEEVQQEAAITGAAVIAAEVVASESAIAAEVSEVNETLVEHAELSEERHEEILEGEQWLQNRTDLLLTTTQALQSQFQLFQVAILAKLDSLFLTVETLREQNQKPLQASSPMIPPEAEAIAVVIPDGSGEDPPVPQTEPKRKTRKVI